MEQQAGKGKAYIALGITSVVWGTTWVASKIGVNEMPALQMAAIRQFIAGLFFVVFFIVVRKLPLPSARQFRWIVVMSVLMFVFANGLSTWSLKYIPTGMSALIGALYPLSVVLIERIFFGSDRITPLTMTGLFLGITGVGIVFYENAFHIERASFGIGLLLSVIAMLSWSWGTIFIARNKANLNPYYGTGWQMVISGVILFIVSEVSNQNIPFRAISINGWAVIAYLVLFGSLISFAAFIYSMKKLPPALSSLYAYINPLVALVTAAFVLGEKLTIHILWGAAVTLVGVFLVNYSIIKEKNKIIAEPEM